MKTTFALSLFIATLTAASVLPNHVLNERLANKCKMFQIFRAPNANSGGTTGYVGTPKCCCQNAQCHVVDPVNGINTSANLNQFLGGYFRIINARGGDKGKLETNDINGATYTVAGLGPC